MSAVSSEKHCSTSMAFLSHSARMAYKFTAVQGARPDHVRVEVQIVFRPRELVGFDP